MKTNKTAKHPTAVNHAGVAVLKSSKIDELRRAVMTCMLFENTFYENGNSHAARIKELVRDLQKNYPDEIADIAIEARTEMHLRHVPLFLIRELARYGHGTLVANALEHIIQRADEPGEFLSLYWKEGRQPLSAGVKRGLSRSFTKFNRYQLSKYNRDSEVKLKDVMFLTHPKPTSQSQERDWNDLISGNLESPDTWEVAISAGGNKKNVFERLLKEGKLGGLAVIRNLRNMQYAGVDESLIRERLSQGLKRVLPFRFVTAARYAPRFEDSIEEAMLKAVEGFDVLPGKTGLLVDVSGSMTDPLSKDSETTRLDVACGLAILLREKAESVNVCTFSDSLCEIAPRRGFALRDAIQNSQPMRRTYLRKATSYLKDNNWKNMDRVIVITDEQSHDGIANAWAPNSWLINIASYKNGVGVNKGWSVIDGWSERVMEYIMLSEGVL